MMHTTVKVLLVADGLLKSVDRLVWLSASSAGIPISPQQSSGSAVVPIDPGLGEVNRAAPSTPKGLSYR